MGVVVHSAAPILGRQTEWSLGITGQLGLPTQEASGSVRPVWKKLKWKAIKYIINIVNKKNIHIGYLYHAQAHTWMHLHTWTYNINAMHRNRHKEKQ